MLINNFLYNNNNKLSKMPVRCAIENCPSAKERGHKVGFFKFPLGVEPLLQAWLKALNKKGWIPTEYSRICELHFKFTDFYQRLRSKRLKADVVPSQNLYHAQRETSKQAVLVKENFNTDYIQEFCCTMITCAVNGCPSTETSKIDGRPVLFFAFPEDDLRKNQWLDNCNLASGVVSDKEPLHLCELHFERINFTASRDLKSNAVPTLFGRIEKPPIRKHKAESILKTKVLPLKQKKLDEHSHISLIPSQKPFIQLIEKTKDSTSENKIDILIDNAISINGSNTSSTITQDQTNKTIYRLIIQIDKIRGKPGPRCKKPSIPLIMLDNNTKDLATSEYEIGERIQPLQRDVKKMCAKGNCKLKKCIYDSKPALQCELCDKYYITKRIESQEDKDNTCSICSMTFPNLQSLYMHVRKHFICDMCQTECSSQMMYDKHARLHVSTNPSYPYKCHQCVKVFELKEDVKQHCSTDHPKIRLQKTFPQVTSSLATTQTSQQSDYRCATCNITFRNDQAYTNHVNIHKKKEGLKCNINETNNVFPVPNPLTGSQIGILQPVKFSCNVCSKEFDNVGEVDIHTRTHLNELEEDLKCNICKKSYKNSAEFSEHLKHHLLRAHPCPVCSKAFINRTTLKIHLKTHDKL